MICKYQDVFFIKQLGTEARRNALERETPKQKLGTYWGCKFETYVFAERGKVSLSTLNMIVNSNEIFLGP